MKILMALLVAVPLVACEEQSVMERAGATLDDAGDEIADVTEYARDEAEEAVD